MKTQSTLAASILSAINQNMDSAMAAAAKVQLAKDAAEKVLKTELQRTEIARKQIRDAVTELAEELQRMLSESQEKAKAEYEKVLIENNLKSEDHPFTPVVEKADEILTVTLSSAGTAARKVADIGQGIAARFMKGFSK